MKRIKEKAPATPASVTSANLNNQVKDTTKKLIRQAECASEVSQTVGLSMMCYTLGKE